MSTTSFSPGHWSNYNNSFKMRELLVYDGSIDKFRAGARKIYSQFRLTSHKVLEDHSAAAVSIFRALEIAISEIMKDSKKIEPFLIEINHNQPLLLFSRSDFNDQNFSPLLQYYFISSKALSGLFGNLFVVILAKDSIKGYFDSIGISYFQHDIQYHNDSYYLVEIEDFLDYLA